MDKILYAIFTCNRFYYFKNCIESVFKFVDQDKIDILVCDNGSVEEPYEDYLAEISNIDNVTVKRFMKRNRNELYRAMNFSVDYAKANGYKIVNFIQDDYQYLYKRDAHIQETVNIFKTYPKIVQVNHNMTWQRKAKSLGKVKNFECGETNYAILLDKRVCDNGFTRVDIYDKIGKYPKETISWGKGKNRYVGKVNGEIWCGRVCHARGWKRAVSLTPNMGMMMDCAYARGGERIGKYFPPPQEFYIKPLDEQNISVVKKRNKKKSFTFIEKMCSPWGWDPEGWGKHSERKDTVIVDPNFVDDHA